MDLCYRLRKHGKNGGGGPICVEAAEEIERLRVELERRPMHIEATLPMESSPPVLFADAVDEESKDAADVDDGGPSDSDDTIER